MGWTERAEEQMDFILDQIKQGKTAVEIDELRAQQMEDTAFERGKQSEQMVIDALKPLPMITDVVKASRESDSLGNDLWVLFEPCSNHRDIPIQVKSSWTGFFNFLSRERRGRRRIVMKVGAGKTDNSIRRIFLGKLKKFDGFI